MEIEWSESMGNWVKSNECTRPRGGKDDETAVASTKRR